jgi:hypothetical protein
VTSAESRSGSRRSDSAAAYDAGPETFLSRFKKIFFKNYFSQILILYIINLTKSYDLHCCSFNSGLDQGTNPRIANYVH